MLNAIKILFGFQLSIYFENILMSIENEKHPVVWFLQYAFTCFASITHTVGMKNQNNSLLTFTSKLIISLEKSIQKYFLQY